MWPPLRNSYIPDFHLLHNTRSRAANIPRRPARVHRADQPIILRSSSMETLPRYTPPPSSEAREEHEGIELPSYGESFDPPSYARLYPGRVKSNNPISALRAPRAPNQVRSTRPSQREIDRKVRKGKIGGGIILVVGLLALIGVLVGFLGERKNHHRSGDDVDDREVMDAGYEGVDANGDSLDGSVMSQDRGENLLTVHHWYQRDVVAADVTVQDVLGDGKVIEVRWSA